MMPQIAFAAPENTASEKTVRQEAAAPEEGDAAEMDLESPAEAEQEEAEASEQYSGNVDQNLSPAFSQTETIDGVRITVEAEQGVFPADAFLQAEKITSTGTLRP